MSDISGFKCSNCPLLCQSSNIDQQLGHGHCHLSHSGLSTGCSCRPVSALNGTGQAEGPALLVPVPREQPGLSQVIPKNMCRFPAPSALSNTPLIACHVPHGASAALATLPWLRSSTVLSPARQSISAKEQETVSKFTSIAEAISCEELV